MSDIIDFLERLGRDSSLRHASRAAIDHAVGQMNLAPEVRAALVSGDRNALEAVFGAGSNVCCMVHVPMTEEDDEPKKQPQKCDPSGSLLPLVRIA